jgi:hypothetical protein
LNVEGWSYNQEVAMFEECEVVSVQGFKE